MCQFCSKMPGFSLQRAIIPLCFSTTCLVLFTISGHHGVPPLPEQQINMYNICMVFQRGERNAIKVNIILFKGYLEFRYVILLIK